MTAVEWLVNELNNQKCWADPARIEIIVQQALEMEKQQHGETWNAAIQAHENRGFVISRSLCDFDEYFENL